MATRSKSRSSTKLGRRAVRPANTAMAPATATPTTTAYQTFPPGNCDSPLPASDVVYEVTVAEFKQLKRTIDSLPYPIVLPAKISGSNIKLAARERVSNAQYYTKAALMGGVPVQRALDRDLSDLAEPAFHDVAIDSVERLLMQKSGEVALKVHGRTVKTTLTAEARADLLAGRPAVVRAATTRDEIWLRLLPASGTPSNQWRGEYLVKDVVAFLERPRLNLGDGREQAITLTERQARELRTTGATTAEVNGVPITLRMMRRDQGREPPEPPDGPSGGPGGRSGGAAGHSGGAAATTPNDASSQPSATSEGSLELVLYLPWKQRWHLKGYSRGQLLYTLTLAPQEETVIEVSSWDRRKRETEESVTADTEQSTEFTETNKDVFGVLNEIKNDNNLSVDTKFIAGIKIAEVVNLTSDVNTGIKAAVTQTSRTTLDHVREATLKATTRLKISRQTKVGETVEVGREEKVTRRVRNPNMCHALTLNYFETLAHYTISTELDRSAARLCVLVDSPYKSPFAFTKANVRVYEGVLRRVLLQPELASGFAAAHKLMAVDQLSRAQMLLKVEMPQMDNNQNSAAVTRAQNVTNESFKAVTTAAKNIYDAAITNGDTNRRRVFYRRRLQEIAPGLWSTLTELRDISTPPNESDLQKLAQALSDITSLEEISRARLNQPGPNEDRLYWIAREEFGVPIFAIWIPPSGFLWVDDAGLVGALRNFQSALAQLSQARAMQQADESAEKATRGGNKLSYSVKEVAEALEQLDALLTHLNEYQSYYRGALLRLMPLDDQLLTLISRFSNLIERRVLGEVNGKLALPIRADLEPRVRTLFAELVGENSQLDDLKGSFDITLPTPGLHIEPRLGDCNACEEYIEELRRIDLHNRRADVALKEERLAQEKLETARYDARLQDKDLSDPENKTGTLRLALDSPVAVTIAKPVLPDE
jgi:hypothetical protein